MWFNKIFLSKKKKKKHSGKLIKIKIVVSGSPKTYIYTDKERERDHLQKQITPFLAMLKKHVFSLCISINLNETAVVVF